MSSRAAPPLKATRLDPEDPRRPPTARSHGDVHPRSLQRSDIACKPQAMGIRTGDDTAPRSSDVRGQQPVRTHCPDGTVARQDSLAQSLLERRQASQRVLRAAGPCRRRVGELESQCLHGAICTWTECKSNAQWYDRFRSAHAGSHNRAISSAAVITPHLAVSSQHAAVD